MIALGFAAAVEARRTPEGARVPAGTPPSASAIGGPSQPLFPPTSFGESSFADFIGGAGGHLSAPLPKPAAKGTDPQPYFRSERTQGYNERTAQFKSELFSGTTRMGVSKTGAYSNKTEAEARFKPAETAGRLRYYGKSGDETFASEDVRSTYKTIGKMTKALPFEQVRVGPGVGKGIDVASADGFHPYFRVMPNNVGDYKKNNLPGGVVPGKWFIDNGTSRDFEFDKKMPKKFYDMQRRPLAKSGDPTAGIRAPMEVPAEPKSTAFITRDQVHPGDLRCPRMQSALAPCGYGEAPLNATGAWAGGGQASMGVSTFGAGVSREMGNRAIDGGRPAPGIGGGILGQMAPGMGIEGYTGDAGRFEKLTRDGTKSFGSFLNNQASSAGAIAPVAPGTAQYSAPQATMRDVTSSRPYNTGIAAVTGDNGTVEAPEIQATNRQLLKHAKRGDQLRGFTPAMNGTRADIKTFGNVGIKDSRERGGRLMGGAELQIARPGYDEKERGDDTRLARKTPVENVYLWNELAADQLRTNMFAKTIAEL